MEKNTTYERFNTFVTFHSPVGIYSVPNLDQANTIVGDKWHYTPKWQKKTGSGSNYFVSIDKILLETNTHKNDITLWNVSNICQLIKVGWKI